jgi:hypothetical protein
MLSRKPTSKGFSRQGGLKAVIAELASGGRWTRRSGHEDELASAGRRST